MNTLDAVYYTLVDEFSTNWADRMPVEYEGEGFTKPDDASWCRFVVRSSTSEITTLNGRRIKGKGRVIIQMFIPTIGTDGRTTINGHIEAAVDSLESRNLDNDITVEAGSPRELGTVDSQYQVNVELPFTYRYVRN